MLHMRGFSKLSQILQLPKAATIYEVGPRDGLQNERTVVPTDVKVKLIDLLTETGLKWIESTSFVSPKWVPQMFDAAAVMTGIKREAGVIYPVLVPNVKGLDAALQRNITHAAVFTAASNAFTQRNINCSIEESLRRFEPVFEKAQQHGVAIRGYVSCVVGCPYQGHVDPHVVGHVARTLMDMGCYEVSLGDTIGVGAPRQVAHMLEAVLQCVDASRVAVHMHNTYGQALANILASLQLGVSVVDSSVAGLGGCPYARGASGNVATEDVVYCLQQCGVETGVDLDRLVDAGHFICTQLARPNLSLTAQAILAKRHKQGTE